jgi:hypothetical protein
VDGSAAPQPVKFDVVAAQTGAWTNATALNTAVTLTVTDYSTVLFSINPSGTLSGGVTTFEASDDAGTTWYAISGIRVDTSAIAGTLSLNAPVASLYRFDVAAATSFRARLSTVISGTGTANIRMQASAAPSAELVSVGNTVKVDGSAVTQPVSIAGNQAVNVAQLAGTTTDTNSGNKSAGTLRVVLATDQPALTNALKVDGSAVTQPVSGTVTSNQGTAAALSGGWPVKVTDGTNTQPTGDAAARAIFTTPTGNASGGAASVSRLASSAATTNATSVKASAGVVYSVSVANANAALRYVHLYNKASAPTVGTDTPILSVPVPPSNGGIVLPIPVGLTFGTGIAYAMTTDAAATNSAVASGDLLALGIVYA